VIGDAITKSPVISLADFRDVRDRSFDPEWFVEWLSSYAARQVIENFRTAEGRRFFPVEVPGAR